MMNRNFVIMGLPASGKTTFLAALWHLVEAGEVACRLKLDRYEGDLAYLNKIAEAWRTFKKVPRTSQVGDQDVVIHLIDSESGRTASAFFPDLAGETFDGQVELRRCRPTFVDGIAGDDGILFFVTADRKEDDLSIVELNKRLPDIGGAETGGAGEPAVEAAGEPAVEATIGAAASPGGGAAAEPAVEPARDAVASKEPEPIKPVEWNPKAIPAQVRVVQLLTDLMRAPFATRKRRVALIISAWDLVDGLGISPASWIERNMPLLAQFLATNREAFDHVVFGVSAQGVKLDDAPAVDQAAQLTPSRRIRVIGPDGAGHDLTLPLIWLISEQ